MDRAERAARIRRALPGDHRGALGRRAASCSGCWTSEATVQEPEGGWPGVTRADPRLQRGGGDRDQRRGRARLRLPAARGARPRRRLHRRHRGGGDRGGGRRRALPRDPRPRQPRQGRAAQRRLRARPGTSSSSSPTPTRTCIPQALKLLVARMSRSPLLAAVAGAPHVTNRGRLLLRDAGARGGGDHRADPPHPVAHRPGRRRRRRARAVPPRPGARRRRLRPRGWRPRTSTSPGGCCSAGWQTAYEPRALVGMQVPSIAAARCGRSASAGRAGRARSCTFTCARSAAGATAACGCWASSRSRR